MSKHQERAEALCLANEGKEWADVGSLKRDELREQATREGFTADHDPTDPDDAVEGNMRSRLGDLRLLIETRDAGTAPDGASGAELEALGFDLDNPDAVEQAEELLDEFPLSVERTTLVEVVLGTGGPDDRLIFECSTTHDYEPAPAVAALEVRRVLYRFSWGGKSAERVLSGEDKKTAEAFAARIVPELG